MPYYNNIKEDLAEAKEILERGRDCNHLDADTYAAYRLLESFVEVVEAIGPKICEIAVREEQLAAAKHGGE
jgi:hypothetical protein